MANLTKCAVCDNTYSYCPNCANTHAWKFYTDSHECYQIFMAIMEYKKGLISKDEARKQLERLGFTSNSNLERYKPSIAVKIKEIFTADKADINIAEEKTVLRKSKKSKLYKDD